MANEEHQVEFNLAQNLPGISEITARLAIGERMRTAPYFAVGPKGTIVRSAQIRLLLNAKLLGSGALSGLTINLPLYVESAYGEARIDAITCHSSRPLKADVDVDTRPGLAMVAVASMTNTAFGDFNSRVPLNKAKLVDAPSVKLSAIAKVESSNNADTTLEFDERDIPEGTIKSVSTRNFLETAINSLLANLQVEASVSGLTLGTPYLLSAALVQQLSGVAATVDHVAASTLDLLGIRLGEADVMLTGLDCQNSVLVQ